MRDIRFSPAILFLWVLSAFSLSCGHFDSGTKVVSQTSHKDSTFSSRIKRAKGNILKTKQSLKLAIIKLNLMESGRGRENSKNKRFIFMQAKSFAPFAKGKFNDSFHLFMGDPIFTKLVPEFYQLLSLMESKKIKLAVDCRDLDRCPQLISSLKKQFKIQVQIVDRDFLAKHDFLFMLSSENLALKPGFPSKFRSAFKHQWLDIPSFKDQNLKIEEWANLIPKVKEF